MTDRPTQTPEERARRGGRSAAPDAFGIVGAFEDAFGAWYEVADDVRDRLRLAMGVDPDATAPPDTDDAVLVVRAGEQPEVGRGEVVTEDGASVPVAGRLQPDLPLGHHDLHRDRGVTRLIVSPGVCHLPDDLRTWGLAAQVYALSSAGSWGIGDLADLRALGGWLRGEGAGTVLVNPLDAVAPVAPREPSPYYPATRRFLDPLYLRVEEVPGADGVDLTGWRREARGQGAGTIDRDRVAAAKLAALRAVWDARPGLRDDAALRAWRAEQGASLERFAAWSALCGRHGPRWREWPTDLQTPERALAAADPDEVDFHVWLQWCTATQLAAAGRALPLLRDLPIGFDPAGFDAWEWQSLLADGVTIGAPPDALGPSGQDWQLPAFVPFKLRAAAYAPFVETLRAAFAHAGGLRIDHVLGLFRLYWVPAGAGPTQGTYVRQPTRELLDILALESHRAQAWVVGEDLGTVEEGVREELAARRALRYQVWWFEADPVAAWEPQALASVTTHDLPTVAGMWTGADADVQRRAGLEPDEAWLRRLRDRVVAEAGVADDAPVEEATAALHALVASAPNRVALGQLDDAIGVTERINVPGTDRTARPANWSLPLPVAVEDLPDHPTCRRVVDALRTSR